MKRVIINTYQIGLVFRKGAYQRMLKEGTYWLRPSEKAETYDVTKPFTPAYELNILLQDTQLAEALHVVQVKDHEIVTRSLLNTAKLIEDNPMLFKLKEMEYVEKIAEKINSISVSGNAVLIDQLRQIFVPQK
jgi:regulator of protease activity HflC (stomatin/prohibitin superfamily)